MVDRIYSFLRQKRRFKNSWPFRIAVFALIASFIWIGADGFAFAGANAYKVDKIVSVKEVFESLMQEYHEHINYLIKSKKGGIFHKSEKSQTNPFSSIEVKGSQNR